MWRRIPQLEGSLRSEVGVGRGSVHRGGEGRDVVGFTLKISPLAEALTPAHCEGRPFLSIPWDLPKCGVSPRSDGGPQM